MLLVGIVVQSDPCVPILPILLTCKSLSVFCFLLTFSLHQNS